MVDGQELPQNLPGRLRSRWQSLMVSKGERDEAEIEEQIRTVPGVTRANTVAMISPKGGVGKTTSSFVVGNLLSNTLRMRTSWWTPTPTSAPWPRWRPTGCGPTATWPT